MDPLVPLSQSFLTFGARSYGFLAVIFILILVLILLSAFFSATETAFTCCNRVRMKVKAENGKRSAKLVCKILDMYDEFLITILIGNNIVNLTISALATIVTASIFQSEGLAAAVSTAVITILIFMFGEVIPKHIAKANPDRFVLIWCYPLFVIHILFYPLMKILNFILWLFKKIFRVSKDENVITEDEFQGIIETVEEEGGIDEEESDIIQAAVDFGDITVKDVLTPIEKISAINIRKTSRKELIDYLKNIEFSRIPVYDGTIENIIGILHVRKFLKNIMKTKNFAVRSAITEAVTVYDSYPLDEMIELYKKRKTHMAIVKNKEGKIIGLVTMEDVLEELVGELTEETPSEGGNA